MILNTTTARGFSSYTSAHCLVCSSEYYNVKYYKLFLKIVIFLISYLSYVFTAQLWRLTSESKLESLYSSIWEFENNTWTIIPSADKEGCIEVKDSNLGKVLAINGEEVILEDKAEKSKSSQLWIKGSENSDGYFSLKNIETGKFLTLSIHKVKEERTTLISVKGKASLV